MFKDEIYLIKAASGDVNLYITTCSILIVFVGHLFLKHAHLW